MRWPWQPPGDEETEMQEIAEQLIAHLEDQAESLQTRAESLKQRAEKWKGHYA
jgi:hypothetical protein